MPPIVGTAKTLRPSVIRRQKKKKKSTSARARRSYKGSAQRKTLGVPLAFQEFNRMKRDAEFRGSGIFKMNGNTYQRHEWTNGVSVWKRV